MTKEYEEKKKELDEFLTKCAAYWRAADDADEARKWAENYMIALNARRELDGEVTDAQKHGLEKLKVVLQGVGVIASLAAPILSLIETRTKCDAYKYGYRMITDYDKSGEIITSAPLKSVHDIR